MSIQAGNPLVDGKTAPIDDPTVKKAYQTYFGWLTKDKVVDPAAIGWTNTQALAAFAKGKTGYFADDHALGLPRAGRRRGQGQVRIRPDADRCRRARPAGPANGVEAASILSGDNLLVADYSKNKDLAFAVRQADHRQGRPARLLQEASAACRRTPQAAETSAVGHEAGARRWTPRRSRVATPFTGAWADIQLALTNVAVQSIPDLAKGSVSDAGLDARLADGAEGRPVGSGPGEVADHDRRQHDARNRARRRPPWPPGPAGRRARPR